MASAGQSAEQARQAQDVDAIPTLAWSARPDGSVEFLNRRWLDYTGLSAEEALNWGWTAALHTEDRDRLVDFWRHLLASGEAGEIATDLVCDQSGFDHEELAQHIRVELTVKFLLAELLEGSKREDARVVREHIQAAEGFFASATRRCASDLCATSPCTAMARPPLPVISRTTRSAPS
jgi:hypothetical protein